MGVGFDTFVFFKGCFYAFSLLGVVNWSEEGGEEVIEFGREEARVGREVGYGFGISKVRFSFGVWLGSAIVFWELL